MSDRTAVSLVMDVCGVSMARAQELMEAAGNSTERAIDIHFHQQQQQQQTPHVPQSQPPLPSSSSSSTSSLSLSLSPSSSTLSSPLQPKKKKPRTTFPTNPKVSAFFAPKPRRKGASTPSSPSLSCSTTMSPSKQSLSSSSSSSASATIDASSPTSTRSLTTAATRKPSPSSTKVPKRRAASPPPKTDDRLLYQALADTFEEMASTTKRLAKLDALSNVLKGILSAVGGVGSIGNNDDTNNNNDASSSSLLKPNRLEDGRTLCCALELILGKIASHQPLQVSGSAVSKAVQTVTGCGSGPLRQAYRKTGDLGDAAVSFTRNQRLLVKPQPVSIRQAHATLVRIASQKPGKGSQAQRQAHVVQLLRSCQQNNNELRFLVRTLLGNMRLGANLRTVLAALAMALHSLTNEQQDSATAPAQAETIQTIQDIFDYCPRLDKLSWAIVSGGIDCVRRVCTLEVGTPVNPMLANPAHSMEEVQKLMTNNSNKNNHEAAVAEWKYDGMRCQAHYQQQRGDSNGQDDTMTLYSRHMLDITTQFPDAVEYLRLAKKESVTSFIVDSEIVGVEPKQTSDGDNDDDDPQGGSKLRLLPFQDLSTRRRGVKDEESANGKTNDDNDQRVPICIFAFDLIYLNGQSLVNAPLHRRQAALRQHFQVGDGFAFAQSIHLPLFDDTIITRFLQKAIDGGAEGLMIKLTGETDQQQQQQQQPVHCRYESGARSQTWLKLKRDYVDGFADTIDVVPIGAWYGNGRKAQKGFLSPVLLAVYDEEEDVFRSISRCMSFTDAMYDAMRNYYFSGTPYPTGVGMTETDQPTKEEGETTTEKDGASDNDEPDSLDVEEEDNNNSNNADRVNCYPSRPAALVVTNESPPIWLKPSEVFEVSFADLSLSRVHTAAAGLVDPSRGVALRFPRFIRRRPDKRIDQATTSAEIARLFWKQAKQNR